jgi:hypothetical protein
MKRQIESAKKEAEKKDRQQLGVIVDAALWRRFRATAIQNGETATTALERAMSEELKRHGQKAV